MGPTKTGNSWPWKPIGASTTDPIRNSETLLTLRGAQFIGAGYGIPNIRGDGTDRLHQSRLGLGLPGLRLTAELFGQRKPDG